MLLPITDDQHYLQCFIKFKVLMIKEVDPYFVEYHCYT